MWPPRLTSGFACKSLPRPGLSARTTNWHRSSTRCAAGSGPSVPLGVRLSFFNVCYAFRVNVPFTGDPGFCVNEASQHKDLELLNRARLKWEAENKKTAGKNSDGLCVGFARCCKNIRFAYSLQVRSKQSGTLRSKAVEKDTVAGLPGKASRKVRDQT